ncbi:MAG: TolC family protein [Betaproteobacteria bacterium]|nr:TolC family protein [Betaproteobacteria bacterium]
MRALAVLSLGLLSGCVSFSPDGGFGKVEQAAAERGAGLLRWVRSAEDADSVGARVRELLANPLSAEGAVQIALLNNPGLQARYAELGIAEADLVQASRWSGPKLSFARLTRGDEIERETSVFFDVLGLLSIPLSTKAQEKRFAAAQHRAAEEALNLALQTRKAWFAAVAAQQTAQYMEDVHLAAEASADLARRMAEVGNWPFLTRAREQAFYADTTAQLARARLAHTAAREKLTRLLGLWGEDIGYALPERLPELPSAVREGEELEAQALRQRLDVQAARGDAESLATSLGLTKVTRFVDLVEVGALRKTETGQPVQRGWELELRIPIFDFGGARTARAEHLYMQAVNRAAETAIRARSEVRESYAAYRTAFDIARHYRDEIVPLRKRISEEMLLRYNGMLSSVFELLADSRLAVASVNAYLEAQRDFWMAEADLQMALTTGSPGAMATAAASMAPAGGAPAAH